MTELLVLCPRGAEVPLLHEQYHMTVLRENAPKAERMAALQSAEVIIGEPEPQELSSAKKLKWLQMTWAGADRYLNGDFPKDVLLTTAVGAFGHTIAEHVLALLFSLCRRLPAYDSWEDQGSEKAIAGSTALIYGCGDIGSQVAQRLQVLGVRTVGVCRQPKKRRSFFDVQTTLSCSELFFREADFIICALPHSSETEGFFDLARLSALKDDAVFINVGRGSLVHTQALTERLQEGKFFGVGLDVVQPEPLPLSHPLWHMKNVILTPHVAGVGFGHLRDTEERIWAICRENLQRYLQNEPLKNQVELP